MKRRLDRVGRRGGRRDESGQALVEFALVLPLLILLMSVAFNGWNGIQLDLGLTSAARAGAITAANDLSQGQGANALTDATSAINAEEGVTGVYQSTMAGAPNYVSISETPDTVTAIPPESPITINVVTITISGASVSLVPVIGNIAVSAHATAEYT